MAALYIQPREEEDGMVTEGGEGKSELRHFASSVSSSEAETDEDSEPEPPPVLRRKVSFADAFGLDLVSVKEFDNAETAEAEVDWSDAGAVGLSPEDFFLSCLFVVPSSAEELDQRMEVQKLELESIELLPGTTTLRGIVRVANLCYSKSVFARMSLDRWRSYFDLLAEYVPGSSDRKTDRFAFRYTLIPPADRDGTRVEFCLRYETPMGTYWANNKDMNYVLFCQQRRQAKEQIIQTEEENNSYKSKRSCLKAYRNGDMQGRSTEKTTSNMSPTEVIRVHKLEETCDAKIQMVLQQKTLVETVKSRRKASRLARVQDFLSQRRQPQQPGASPPDAAGGLKASQPVTAASADSASRLCKSPQVLTYHQIPLLPLDWSNDPPEQWGAADILPGRAKMTLSKASEEDAAPVNDMWRSLPETARDSSSKAATVSDAWQLFLNGPGCKGHSDVPESEWLQTAALVSPSNEKATHFLHSVESEDFEKFSVAEDTPAISHASAECHPLSDACETPSAAAAALDAKDGHSARVSGPGDAAGSSTTDTALESDQERALPVSEVSADSAAEYHQDEEGEGTDRDEPKEDLRETETTDATETQETQKAGSADTISEGARQDGEHEVRPSELCAVEDILALQETTNRARLVSSASGRADEESRMNHGQKEETFISHNHKNGNTSPMHEEQTERKEWRQTQSEENPQEDRDVKSSAQSNSTGLNSSEKCGENIELLRISRDDGAYKQNKGRGEEIIRIFGEFALQNKETLQRSSCEQMKEEMIIGVCEMSFCTKEEHRSKNGEQPFEENSLDSRENSPGQKEISSPGNVRATMDSRDVKEPPFPPDKSKPKPLESVESRLTHSLQNLKGQLDDKRGGIKAEGASVNDRITIKDVSTRAETDLRPEIETICFGKPKIEAQEEMDDNTASPQEERDNVWKGEEFKRAECSQSTQLKKTVDGRKYSTTVESSPALEGHSPGLERLGEKLASGILEEVFASVQPSISRKDAVDEMESRQTDSTAKVLSFKQGSSTHLPEVVEKSANRSISTSQPLTETNPRSDDKDSPHPPRALGLPKDRNVLSAQETCQSSAPFSRCPDKHPHAADRLQQADAILWWTLFYTLTHITRLLICALLVGGFFFVVFLFDFPAFFALYVFSLTWWIFRGKKQQVVSGKADTG